MEPLPLGAHSLEREKVPSLLRIENPSPREEGGGCGLLGLGKLSGRSIIEHSPRGLWAPDVSFWHRPDLDEPHNWLLGRGHWQTQAYSGSFAYHLHLSAYAVAQPGLLCI